MAWRRRPETPCEIIVKDIVVSGDAGPECADACPTGALRAEGGRLVAEPGLCAACIACMALCGPGRVRILTDWRCPGGEPVEPG